MIRAPRVRTPKNNAMISSAVCGFMRSRLRARARTPSRDCSPFRLVTVPGENSARAAAEQGRSPLATAHVIYCPAAAHKCVQDAPLLLRCRGFEAPLSRSEFYATSSSTRRHFAVHRCTHGLQSKRSLGTLWWIIVSYSESRRTAPSGLSHADSRAPPSGCQLLGSAPVGEPSERDRAKTLVDREQGRDLDNRDATTG